MFPDLVSLLGSLGDRDEQVLHFLIVDFHHGDHDLILLGAIVVVGDPRKDLLATDGHDTLVRTVSHHRVGFACTRLAICEETAVVALPCVFEDLDTDLLEDVLLVCVFGASGNEVAALVGLELVMRPEGVIEGEVTGLAVLEVLGVQ